MSEPCHVLRLSCGITATLKFDEVSGRIAIVWSRRPPRKLLSKILKGYRPCRDQIIDAWAPRNGKRVLVVEL